jgi:SPP1 family predicted phage head-tail adaptor
MATARRIDGSYALNPGNLRHAITIQRASKTQNTYGEDVVTWPALLTAHAQIRAMQGRELEAYQQQWAEARWKIRMWLPDVTIMREDQIIWGTRTLDILDAEDPDGTGRTLEIVAREVVA